MKAMSAGRRKLFREAMAAARRARKAGELAEAFAQAERAHVIGQYWVGPHLRAHGEMLRVGLRRADQREALGQLMRLALVVPGTLTGRLPEGNTGGANVSAFDPMPISDDLRRELEAADGQPERCG